MEKIQIPKQGREFQTLWVFRSTSFHVHGCWVGQQMSAVMSATWLQSRSTPLEGAGLEKVGNCPVTGFNSTKWMGLWWVGFYCRRRWEWVYVVGVWWRGMGGLSGTNLACSTWHTSLPTENIKHLRHPGAYESFTASSKVWGWCSGPSNGTHAKNIDSQNV